MLDADKDRVRELCGDAKKKRMDNDLIEARHSLSKAKALLDAAEESQSLDEWSLYHYEDGFLLSAEGDADLSIKSFEKSAIFGRKAGNLIAEHVGLFRTALTAFLADKCDTVTAYRRFQELEATLLSVKGREDLSASWLEGHAGNLRKRLIEVSFDAAPQDFIAYVEEDFSNANYSDGIPDVHRALMIAQNRARLKLANGLNMDAVIIISSYLGIKLDGVVVDADIPHLDKIKNIVHQSVEEVARDYRDLSRALLRTDLEDRKALAHKVLKLGVKLPAVRGNWRFIREMNEELSALGDID